MNKKETGKLGEYIAYKYLLSKGYLILAKNQREYFYEIDIIGKDSIGNLIFFEVKTINKAEIVADNKNSFNPEDNMTHAKIRRLKRGATIFLVKHPHLIKDGRGWQIDLLAITLISDRMARLWHYKNI